MAPNAASVNVRGTPAFLARVMALPAFSDALVLATQAYDTTKKNEVMGAALRAAEASMIVAASGALPLAAPILERVGGWQRVDEWACRCLDMVEQAAPIIKKPTKELVNTTRQRVLGAVAGDQVIVPDTLTEAIIARANLLMEVVTESVGVRTATEAAERMLDTAHGLVNTNLFPGKGDHLYPDEASAGVRGRSLLLVRKTGHGVYRTTLRTLRPDLASRPDAVITVNMVVEFGRAKLVDLTRELVRESKPGEEVGVAMTLVRRSARVAIDTFTQVNALLRDLSLRKVVDAVAASFPPDTKALVETLRSTYTDLLTRLSPAIQTSIDRLRSTYTDLITRLSPVVQTSINRLRSTYTDLLTRLSPVIQTSIDRLRSTYTDLLTRLSPVVQTSIDRLRSTYTDLLTRLSPVIQTSIDRLRSTYTDLLTRLSPVVQTSIDRLRSTYTDLLTRLSPVVQTSIDRLRSTYTDLLTRLSPVVQTSIDRLRSTYTDLLTRLSPVVQTSIDRLRSTYTDVLARLTPATRASVEWLRNVSKDSLDRLSLVIQVSLERVRLVYIDGLGRLPPEVQAPIERLVNASTDAVKRISPNIQTAFIRARSGYDSFVSRLTPFVQEALKTLREMAMDPVTRLPPLLQTVRATAADGAARLVPLVQARVDAFRRSVSAARAMEAGAVVLDYSKYVAEEARLWSKVAIVMLQLSLSVAPSVALRISQTTRIFTGEWLRSTMTSLEVRGRPVPTLYRKGFVPVKVSMLVPSDAHLCLGEMEKNTEGRENRIKEE